jgi:hypothetical protein
MSRTAGPLGSVPVTFTGHNLAGVTRVTFGGTPATRLKHVGGTTLSLRVPARTRPGTVPVRAVSGGTAYAVGSYVYVARPLVTGLSSSSGAVQGGTSVKITGQHLATNPIVRFGTVSAPITSARASALRVTVPPNIAGAQTVTVTTPGGRSPASPATKFTYVLPPAVDSATYTPADGTVVASGVQWVSGGTDPNTGTTSDWVVSISAGTNVPAIGAQYVLEPGGDVFPAGLAGTVSATAAQGDGSTRLTISPTPIEDALADATIQFSDGPSATPAAKPQQPFDTGGSTGEQFSFQGLGPNVFNCHDKDGLQATFQGELGLKFERFNRDFFFQLGVHPSISGFVSGSLVTYGKVTTAASIKCKLKPSWSDANRKILPLGDGATLSFGPTAEIKISAKGTVSYEQTTRFMYGLSKFGDNPVTFYRIAKQSAMVAKGSASVNVELTAGLSVQIGILDRVGVEIKAELAAEGSLSLQSGPQVCVDLSLGVKLSIGAFLDVIVARWEYTALAVTIDFASYHKCSAPDSDAPPDSNPVITSTTLPDAMLGVPYDVSLTTADGRFGTWQSTNVPLPPGLSLSADGVISGTLTGGVGVHYPTVRFVDEQLRIADAVLYLRVLPDTGLQGGDLQATLTWSTEADLDLHAIEPDNNEIYYGNPGPSANGGELDHDANAACQTVDPAPAENIHWTAPSESGQYQFAAVTYDVCGAANLDWHLVVRVKGVVVVDVTGSDTSSWYVVDYSSSTGAVTVHQVPMARGAVASVTAK